jgi:hypothetical protein
MIEAPAVSQYSRSCCNVQNKKFPYTHESRHGQIATPSTDQAVNNVKF